MSYFDCFLKSELRPFKLFHSSERDAVSDECVSKQALVPALLQNANRTFSNCFRVLEFVLSDEDLRASVVDLSDADFVLDAYRKTSRLFQIFVRFFETR